MIRGEALRSFCRCTLIKKSQVFTMGGNRYIAHSYNHHFIVLNEKDRDAAMCNTQLKKHFDNIIVNDLKIW